MSESALDRETVHLIRDALALPDRRRLLVLQRLREDLAQIEPPAKIDELKRLRELIPEEFTGRQRDRLGDLYGKLNDPPLMIRLRWRLAEESVPISEGETALLDRLRRVRNPVTHGSEPERMPERDEIEHAISVVARMLVFRVARR